jgi:hypothetical protein
LTVVRCELLLDPQRPERLVVGQEEGHSGCGPSGLRVGPVEDEGHGNVR